MKKIIPFSLFLLSPLFLTGCGNNEPDVITLQVGESLWGPDEFIQEAGRIFTERNPHIQIEFVNLEVGGAAGQILLDGPAGLAPDVFAAPHDQLGQLVTAGLVLPVYNSDYVLNHIAASSITAVTFDGIIYGYPIAAETYALFYNRNLISSSDVPSTFESLKPWVENFNQNSPADQFGFMFDVGSAYYTFLFTTNNGNRLFGPSGTDVNAINMNTPNAVEGMYFFQSLRSILDVPAGDMTTAIADAAFGSGNAAMHISGPWNIQPFIDMGVDFGITTLPALPGQNTPPASFAGTRSMFVSAFTYHPEEAYKFAAFLVSDEMQALRFDITGALPSSSTLPIDSPHFAGFIAQLEYAFPMPSIPEMAFYWSSMDAAAANIWNGAGVQEQLDMVHQAISGS